MGSTNVTKLLAASGKGDDVAATKLMPLVYDELRRLAAQYLHQQCGADITLQATAIVHEAFLRLVRQDHCDEQSRTHFFATAALAMRHVLIDHLRRNQAAKRGGGTTPLTLIECGVESEGTTSTHDLIALNETLERLAELSPRAARVVDLRVFGGMANEEIAVVLGVCERTVKEDWRIARAWLKAELKRGTKDDTSRV